VTTRHFLLTPVGSSGDVHPFIGIGRGLRSRGHDVTILTAEPFREVIARAGLRFVPTHSTEEFDRVSQDPALWHPRRGIQRVLTAAAQGLRREYDQLAACYEPGRTVLAGHPLAFATRLFEEAHHAPAATIQLAPSVFRSRYQQPVHYPGYDASGYPAWLTRTLWWVIDRAFIDPYIVPALNRFRREMGLGPISRVFQEWLHSPQRVLGLFPEWFGPPQPDWPAQLRLTGFPLYDEADQHGVPPALEAFLRGGAPPVLFTFGSANRAAGALLRTGAAAAARLGQRAVLLTRHADQIPRGLPAGVHHERYVPLSLLLPRCAAIVHHGGIGTCAQGLAAGIPHVVVPLAFDQPDNAARLERLGVGRWVLPTRLTPPRLADAIAPLLSDPAVRERCRRWANAIQTADAVDAACRWLEDIPATTAPMSS